MQELGIQVLYNNNATRGIQVLCNNYYCYIVHIHINSKHYLLSSKAHHLLAHFIRDRQYRLNGVILLT